VKPWGRRYLKLWLDASCPKNSNFRISNMDAKSILEIVRS
jgi:hypothetical protein